VHDLTRRKQPVVTQIIQDFPDIPDIQVDTPFTEVEAKLAKESDETPNLSGPFIPYRVPSPPPTAAAESPAASLQ
jgi:hypothetical protein